MAQKTLVIDLDRCIGCHACEVACKVENNVPMGVYYNKVLTIGPVGKYPSAKTARMPPASRFARPVLLTRPRTGKSWWTKKSASAARCASRLVRTAPDHLTRLQKWLKSALFAVIYRKSEMYRLV